MPTKREEEERAAAHPSSGGASPAPGWYPDPAEDSREWHWDGTAWTGKYRERRVRNNFAGTYNLLPTWAQITVPIVVVLIVIGVIAGGGESEEDGFNHPGIERIERERAQRERELEEELTERRLTRVAGSEPA